MNGGLFEVRDLAVVGAHPAKQGPTTAVNPPAFVAKSHIPVRKQGHLPVSHAAEREMSPPHQATAGLNQSIIVGHYEASTLAKSEGTSSSIDCLEGVETEDRKKKGTSGTLTRHSGNQPAAGHSSVSTTLWGARFPPYALLA